MYMEYVDLVLTKLRSNEYCLLTGKVLLTIYFKLLEPKNCDARKSNINDRYTKSLGTFQLTYLTVEDNVEYICKMDNFSNFDSLELKCINIYVEKDMVNRIFHKNYKYFEEELYYFITLLNFDPTKLINFLNMSSSQLTNFIPIDLKMMVSSYDVKQLEPQSGVDIYSSFGKKDNDQIEFLFTRECEGRISRATSKELILSLRHSEPFKKCLKNAEWVKDIQNPYIIYLHKASSAIFPLAYNVLENPIITGAV